MSVTDLRWGLNLTGGRGESPREGNVCLPSFVVMTDEARLPDPLAAIRSLPRKSVMVLRHYGARDRVSLAAELVRTAHRQNIRVLIAADAALAVKVGADGLHLPEAMVARGPGAWKVWRKPGWLVTASAHSLAALFRARAAGADAALLAPVFPSASHPGGRSLGVLRFTAWCRQSPLPVYALGGISGKTSRVLKNSQAKGFAGISGFLVHDR